MRVCADIKSHLLLKGLANTVNCFTDINASLVWMEINISAEYYRFKGRIFTLLRFQRYASSALLSSRYTFGEHRASCCIWISVGRWEQPFVITSAVLGHKLFYLRQENYIKEYSDSMILGYWRDKNCMDSGCTFIKINLILVTTSKVSS